jgi:hypothetical protein
MDVRCISTEKYADSRNIKITKKEKEKENENECTK